MRPFVCATDLRPREATQEFSLAEARAIVHGLTEPDARVDWSDFLISLMVAYSFASIYLLAPLFSWQRLVCLPVAAIALHRVTNFMHEIAHLRSNRKLRGFCARWDILAGVPMLIPSCFFENHLAHHNGSHFGAERDCE